MDILEVMRSRHSIRQYKNKDIEITKKSVINSFIDSVNAESNLAIQAFFDEPKCFDSFIS